jgi:hypothetical protein
MNYLVAVLPDRVRAEEAYSALEKAGLPVGQVAILGRGYQSADEYGLIDPAQSAKRGFYRLLPWVVPFGFVAGYAFNVLTGIELFTWAGSLGNHVVGGVLGALSGAIGAFFVGGGVGASMGSGDALPYRNRLQEGKYLVVVKGTAEIVDRATPVLRQFSPENLQGYADQTKASV